jgi:hypothetical protein
MIMFCNNCGTEYETTQIDNGKSRFCRSCGSLLYKNQNGQLIDSEGKPFINTATDTGTGKLNIDEEHQKLLEQERLIKERQNQLLHQKREQELKEKQERERLEAIRKQQEQERQKAEQKEKERLLQLQREQDEKERLLREKIEKEVREKIQREQAEKERLEQALKEKLERERIERELREAEEKKKAAQLLLEKEAEEKRKAVQQEQEKAATAAMLQTAEQPSGGTFRKFLLFVLLPLLAAGILAGTTYFLFPQQIKAVLGITASEAKTTEAVSTPENIPSDNSAIIEQIKTALTGKEVLSWGPIKADEIKGLTIQSQQAENGNPSYVVELNLDDNAGTKAAAELEVTYNNNTIDKATTNKISYKNTAPVNAWFSFAPLKNCTILVNTNGNPIKLKGCQNCASVSLNTSADQPEKLINHPETIFIQSGSTTETTVDFTYVPTK